VHEVAHVFEEGDGFFVLGFELRVADVAQPPVEGPVQVGDAVGDGGADVVERGGGVVVGPGEA
jgi:hypothetical protein